MKITDSAVVARKQPETIHSQMSVPGVVGSQRYPGPSPCNLLMLPYVARGTSADVINSRILKYEDCPLNNSILSIPSLY